MTEQDVDDELCFCRVGPAEEGQCGTLLCSLYVQQDPVSTVVLPVPIPDQRAVLLRVAGKRRQWGEGVYTVAT